MCTILLFYKVFETAPLVVASNRDERYRRRSSLPEFLSPDRGIVGGRDLEAGGTWMGLNRHGLWVGIANHQRDVPDDPQLRSRGLLCMDLLGCSSCEEALALLKEIPERCYNPFHLAVAGKESGIFVRYEKRAEVIPLTRGVHVMTNQGVDRDSDPRRERILEKLRGVQYGDRPPSMDALKELMRDHGEEQTDAVCIHREEGGTRSSTLLVLHHKITESEYYFADGPPCRTGYHDYSELLKFAAA